MFQKVRIRITALTLAIVTLLYTISAIAVFGIVQHVVYQNIDGRLTAVVRNLTGRSPERVLARLPEGFYGLVIATGGTFTNAPPAVEDRLLTLHPSGTLRIVTVTDQTGSALRVLGIQDARGIQYVAADVNRELDVMGRLKQVLFIVGLFGLGASALGGFFLAERALRPIRQAWHRQLEFVADASHELRTPLTVIQSNLNVVMDHTDESVADNLEWINNAYSESRRMAKLVQDLLTLARSDTQSTPLERTRVDLADVVARACELFDPVVTARFQTLQHHLTSRLVVEGDQDRLHQLLVILLDNASKYTPAAGRIDVTLTSRRHQATLEVRDTGAGIPRDSLAKVFERFYQVESSRGGEAGRGAGLGLAIAKWIVDAHHGKIAVVSDGPGRGTTFTVVLPLD